MGVTHLKPLVFITGVDIDLEKVYTCKCLPDTKKQSSTKSCSSMAIARQNLNKKVSSPTGQMLCPKRPSGNFQTTADVLQIRYFR